MAKKQQAITTEVSPIAAERLSKDEIAQAVRTAAAKAEATKGWAVGKGFELGFTKAGKGYRVVIDWKSDGYHAIVGLPQEVVREPGK